MMDRGMDLESTMTAGIQTTKMIGCTWGGSRIPGAMQMGTCLGLRIGVLKRKDGSKGARGRRSSRNVSSILCLILKRSF